MLVVAFSVLLLASTPYFSVGNPLSSEQPPSYDCDTLISETYCTGGTYQELGVLYEKCGKPQDAKYAEAYCLKNAMDQYCVLIDTAKYKIVGVCNRNSSFCSQDCKEALIQARQELGCCIPSFFNSTELGRDDQRFRYSLWSDCNVEPVTQRCPPGDVIIPPTPIDPTCTPEVLRAGQQSVTCRRAYIEDIHSKLSEKKGCENYQYPGIGSCLANTRKVYCELIYSMQSNFTEGSYACARSSCAPDCAKVLRSISETSGCCFINKYGNQDLHWLKPEFWSMCGVTFPGHCKQYLNNDSPASLSKELEEAF